MRGDRASPSSLFQSSGFACMRSKFPIANSMAQSTSTTVHDNRKIEGDAALGIAHVMCMLKSLHSDPLTPKLGEIRCSATGLLLAIQRNAHTWSLCLEVACMSYPRHAVSKRRGAPLPLARPRRFTVAVARHPGRPSPGLPPRGGMERAPGRRVRAARKDRSGRTNSDPPPY